MLLVADVTMRESQRGMTVVEREKVLILRKVEKISVIIDLVAVIMKIMPLLDNNSPII